MTRPAATILIVDDEIQNCKLLEMLLRHEGYLTLSAANGEEALASIAQRAPDLILLDIMMPGMDGYQVAGILKANPATSNIPIIMVTALIDRSARIAGLGAGADEFLTKPIDRTELCLRVRNLLRLNEHGDSLQNHGRILKQQVQARTADLQLFRAAMDATADAIFLVNRRTMRFVEVNATACNLLGYTREELFQLGPSDLSAAPLEQLGCVYDAVIAGQGTTGLMETYLRCKDGSEVQVEVNRHAQRAGAGAGWIIVDVVRDITKRKQAQAEILRLNAELEERVRQRTAQLQAANQELEAFSYSVPHDLRTPLSSIDRYSHLLGNELGVSAAGERSKHYLTLIRAGVVQMGELIDALLSLAQISRASLRWGRVDLSAMAETILNGYRAREPGRVVQLLAIQPDLMVQGDPILLQQALDNLLGNAWKFSGQQPRTRIAFGRESGPDGEVVYAVRDNGASFDMADSEKTFGAFRRLHTTVSEFAGTGLGLAVVYRIIARHGGRVWAESVPGQGATFYFTLGGPPA